VRDGIIIGGKANHNNVSGTCVSPASAEIERPRKRSRYEPYHRRN
jgi:hypothetical protein